LTRLFSGDINLCPDVTPVSTSTHSETNLPNYHHFIANEVQYKYNNKNRIEQHRLEMGLKFILSL